MLPAKLPYNSLLSGQQVNGTFPLGQPGIKKIGLASAIPKEGTMAVTSGWGRTRVSISIVAYNVTGANLK